MAREMAVGWSDLERMNRNSIARKAGVGSSICLFDRYVMAMFGAVSCCWWGRLIRAVTV